MNTAHFSADADVQRKVAQTLNLSHLDAGRFDAVFFPEGHGTTCDLPGGAGVTSTVESAYALCKVIASVCQGLEGLVTAKRPD